MWLHIQKITTYFLDWDVVSIKECSLKTTTITTIKIAAEGEINWGFNVEVQGRYRMICGIYTDLQSLIPVSSSYEFKPLKPIQFSHKSSFLAKLTKIFLVTYSAKFLTKSSAKKKFQKSCFFKAISTCSPHIIQRSANILLPILSHEGQIEDLLLYFINDSKPCHILVCFINGA